MRTMVGMAMLCALTVCTAAQTVSPGTAKPASSPPPSSLSSTMAPPQADLDTSLADQARANTKNKSHAAKVVADNDSIEQARSQTSPIPDVGLENVTIDGIVQKMLKFRDTHSSEQGKQVISDWFTAQQEQIDQQKQKQEMFQTYHSQQNSPNMDSGTWWRNFDVKTQSHQMDVDQMHNLSTLISTMEYQLGRVRILAPQRGIPAEWVPKEPAKAASH